jgi:Rps23 Pro-64 3,4-dihydroxylase Tpa1-like proline 4-hydroxylase
MFFKKPPRRNLKEYFKEKWYTDEEINNHYEYKKYLNKRNKEKLELEIEKHKKEIEIVKQFWIKVKPSLVWDWLWFNEKKWNTRQFVRYSEINKLKDYI